MGCQHRRNRPRGSGSLESTNVAVDDVLGMSFSCVSGATHRPQSTPDMVSTNYSDERALRDEFLDDEQMRLNQHLARAHIQVQEEMERRLAEDAELDIYGREFLCLLRLGYQSSPFGTGGSSRKA